MNIEKYENSFDKYSFKECLIEKYENSDNLNPRYYEKTINSWYEQRCNELKSNNRYKVRFPLLMNYLLDLKFLFISIIELYEAVERYNNIKVRLNIINIKQHRVITQIEHLQEVNLVIRENLNKGLDSTGKKIKDFVLLKLDDITFILKSIFYIDILKSPLKKPYQETYYKIENSTKQIGTIQNIKEDNYYEYFEITILFAQGFIKALKGEKCSYKDINFSNHLELEKHLKQNVIKEIEEKKSINIRQYVRNTLTGSGIKNLYSNKNLMNKTFEYCKRKSINMTDEFQRKRIELNN
jgi:hypothetical protein